MNLSAIAAMASARLCGSDVRSTSGFVRDKRGNQNEVQTLARVKIIDELRFGKSDGDNCGHFLSHDSSPATA